MLIYNDYFQKPINDKNENKFIECVYKLLEGKRGLKIYNKEDVYHWDNFDYL